MWSFRPDCFSEFGSRFRHRSMYLVGECRVLEYCCRSESALRSGRPMYAFHVSTAVNGRDGPGAAWRCAWNGGGSHRLLPRHEMALAVGDPLPEARAPASHRDHVRVLPRLELCAAVIDLRRGISRLSGRPRDWARPSHGRNGIGLTHATHAPGAAPPVSERRPQCRVSGTAQRHESDCIGLAG